MSLQAFANKYTSVSLEWLIVDCGITLCTEREQEGKKELIRGKTIKINLTLAAHLE